MTLSIRGRAEIFPVSDEELRALPKIYRDVMTSLRAGGNYRYVAADLGIQLGTVRSRLNRAKARVRKERNRIANDAQVKLLNSLGR